MVFNSDLGAICAIGPSDGFGLLWLVELGGLIGLNVNDAFIIAARLSAYGLTLRDPLFRCSSDTRAFRVINVFLGGLDDLVRDGFLHEVHLTLPDDLHQLVLQRNDQF